MAKMNFKILPEKINVVKKFTRKTSLIFSRGHNDKEEIHIKTVNEENTDYSICF